MTFKSSYLKKTNIFFPNVGGILASRSLTTEILDDIIDYEETAYLKGASLISQSQLESVIDCARKQRLLTPVTHRRILFHIMRQAHLPKCGKQDLDVLILAYQDVMSELHRGYPVVHFYLIQGVFYFGYHGAFNLDRDAPFTFEEYKARLAVIAQCNKYVHIPGMLAKIDRFLPFAGDATAWRILGTLRAINYEPLFDAYSVVLAFWGLITILLLNPSTRAEFFNDLDRMKDNIPVPQDKREILKRYVDAIADPDLSQRFAETTW